MTTFCKRCSKEAPDGAQFCPYCGKPFVEAPKKTKKKKNTRRSNGTGTAVQEANGTWTGVAHCGSYTITDENGIPHLKRIRKRKRGFATRTEALSWALTNAYHGGGAEAHQDDTLGDLYAYWYDTYGVTELRGARISANSNARKRIEPLAGIKIKDLTIVQIQSVINTTCKSFDQAKDCKSLLSKIYKTAQIVVDPSLTNLSKFIKLPEKKESEAAAFTVEDLQKMWDAWKNGEVLMGAVIFMCMSGCMPGELLACRKDQVDLEKCEIHGAGMKTKKRRTTAIVFPESLRPVLQSLMDLNPNSEKLVPKNKDVFYDWYHRAVKKYGLSDIPLYSTRHTLASLSAKSAEAPVIQELMRHSSLQMTQHYIHGVSDEAHEVVDQLAISVFGDNLSVLDPKNSEQKPAV